VNVVDASVLVSTFIRADAFNARSRLWLDGELQTGSPIIVPAIALAEVAGAVSRRTGDRIEALFALETLRAMPTLAIVGLDEDFASQAAQVAARTGLRGADATYVAVALELNLPLITWDDDQLRCGLAEVQVLRPS
jgi:predicted nucleic acid-binding protein